MLNMQVLNAITTEKRKNGSYDRKTETFSHASKNGLERMKTFTLYFSLQPRQAIQISYLAKKVYMPSGKVHQFS